MATINVKIYEVIAGAYTGKYIAVAESLNIGLSSPIEVVDTDTYKVKLPDFENKNTNGVVESTLLLSQANVTVEQELPFTQRSGFTEDGTLFLYQNTQMFMMSDNLTTGKVTLIFYGQLSMNPYNGSKFITYLAGTAATVYTIS